MIISYTLTRYGQKWPARSKVARSVLYNRAGVRVFFFPIKSFGSTFFFCGFVVVTVTTTIYAILGVEPKFLGGVRFFESFSGQLFLYMSGPVPPMHGWASAHRIPGLLCSQAVEAQARPVTPDSMLHALNKKPLHHHTFQLVNPHMP